MYFAITLCMIATYVLSNSCEGAEGGICIAVVPNYYVKDNISICITQKKLTQNFPAADFVDAIMIKGEEQD